MSKTTKVSKEKENDIADGHYMYRRKSALGLRSTNPISRNKQVKSTSVTICLLNVIGFNAVKCNLTKLTTKSSFWSVLLVSAIGMVLQAQCHLPLYKAKHVPVWFIIDMFQCGHIIMVDHPWNTLVIGFSSFPHAFLFPPPPNLHS